MNLSRDIVKGILQGSSNIFLVESSSDGSGLPCQWKDHPAWMRLCPVFEAATTDSPSALGSAFVGEISRSLTGNGLDGLFKPLWGLLACERRLADGSGWSLQWRGCHSGRLGWNKSWAASQPSVQPVKWTNLSEMSWSIWSGWCPQISLGRCLRLDQGRSGYNMLPGYPSGGGDSLCSPSQSRPW